MPGAFWPRLDLETIQPTPKLAWVGDGLITTHEVLIFSLFRYVFINIYKVLFVHIVGFRMYMHRRTIFKLIHYLFLTKFWYCIIQLIVIRILFECIWLGFMHAKLAIVKLLICSRFKFSSFYLWFIYFRINSKIMLSFWCYIF